MKPRSKPTTWGEAVRQVHDEAAGLLSIVIVRQEDAAHLVVDALAGDDAAATLLNQVNDCLHRIQAAPTRNRTQCGCCSADLRAGHFAIVIASPDTNDPSAGLGLAICRRCGTSLGAIKAAALTALRCIWPDLRSITITHPGGRA